MTETPEKTPSSGKPDRLITLLNHPAFSLALLGVMMAFAIWVEASGKLAGIRDLPRLIYGISWSLAVIMVSVRLMTNVRFGILLMVMMALGAVAGTFVEQRWDTATAQRNVYHSWWYTAVMLLLAATLNTACMPYYKVAVRLWTRIPALRSAKTIEKLPEVRRTEGKVTEEALAAVLAKQIGPVTEKGGKFFARRGLIQRTGFMITHLGITLSLLVGAWYSISANLNGAPGARFVWVGEGMETSKVRVPILDQPGFSRIEDLPFTLKLHDFDAEMFSHSQVPRFFGSLIEIIPHDGSPNQMFQITMNEAMRWNGWKLSQNSYVMLDETLDVNQGRVFFDVDGQPFIDLLQQGRMAVDLQDNSTGRRFPTFDAGVGCRVEVPQSQGLYFESTDGQTYRLLRGVDVLTEGALLGADGENPVPSEPYTARLSGSISGSYSGLGVMQEQSSLKMLFYVAFLFFALGPYIAFSRLFVEVWAAVDPDTGVAVIGARGRGLKSRLPKTLDLLTKELETSTR